MMRFRFGKLSNFIGRATLFNSGEVVSDIMKITPRVRDDGRCAMQVRDYMMYICTFSG
jgi:hypothetical protein